MELYESLVRVPLKELYHRGWTVNNYAGSWEAICIVDNAVIEAVTLDMLKAAANAHDTACHSGSTSSSQRR